MMFVEKKGVWKNESFGSFLALGMAEKQVWKISAFSINIYFLSLGIYDIIYVLIFQHKIILFCLMKTIMFMIMLKRKIAYIFTLNLKNMAVNVPCVEKWAQNFMPLTEKNFRIPQFIASRLFYMQMFINMIVKTGIVNAKSLWKISRLPKLLSLFRIYYKTSGYQFDTR